jgi:hypothetical protein
MEEFTELPNPKVFPGVLTLLLPCLFHIVPVAATPI